MPDVSELLFVQCGDNMIVQALLDQGFHNILSEWISGPKCLYELNDKTAVIIWGGGGSFDLMHSWAAKCVQTPCFATSFVSSHAFFKTDSRRL